MTKIDSTPAAMATKSRSTVLAEIQQLEKTAKVSELKNYLTQLAKWGATPAQYEPIFKNYLTSTEADLREAAVFSLLFALKIQKPEYRQVALQQLVASDKEDFDARHWAGASLAVAYRGSKDQELLRIFFRILDDAEEDEVIKGAIAGNILLVWGMPSRERVMRVDSFTASLKTILEEFEPELNLARHGLRS